VGAESEYRRKRNEDRTSWGGREVVIARELWSLKVRGT
jgi:hypothetical protein